MWHPSAGSKAAGAQTHSECGNARSLTWATGMAGERMLWEPPKNGCESAEYAGSKFLLSLRKKPASSFRGVDQGTRAVASMYGVR